MNNNDTELKKRLLLVRKYFDTDRIIKPPQEKTQIQMYYHKNHFLYLFVISRHGFMHMGISKNGTYKTEDLFGQAKIIDEYLKKIKPKHVLELGAGNGSNSAYLADKNPKTHFVGIDLSKKKLWRFQKIKNYSQKVGDYHDLGRFEDESFDLIFAVETLCYSANIKKVLEEVYKKLRKDGLFIIFDGYGARTMKELTPDEKFAKQLTEKSMAVEFFENIDYLRDVLKQAKFTVLKEENLNDAVLPSMRRVEKISLRLLKIRFVLKLPFDMVKNLVASLLMRIIVEENIDCYYLHVLKKN